jgi:hypothetical protein
VPFIQGCVILLLAVTGLVLLMPIICSAYEPTQSCTVWPNRISEIGTSRLVEDVSIFYNAPNYGHAMVPILRQVNVMAQSEIGKCSTRVGWQNLFGMVKQFKPREVGGLGQNIDNLEASTNPCYPSWSLADVLMRKAKTAAPRFNPIPIHRLINYPHPWREIEDCNNVSAFGGNYCLGLIGSRFDSSFQLNALPQENPYLNKTDKGQSDGGYYEPSSEINEPPIGRRSFLAILGLLSQFLGGLWGWNFFYKKRRLLGAFLIVCGTLLGAAGMTLLILTGYPSTWNWIL